MATAVLNDDAATVIRRKPLPSDNNLDMTPMIDVTFLLLIFFLVSSEPDKAAPDLPRAEHGVGVAKRTALVISVAQPDDDGGIAVYLSDLKSGEPLSGTRAAQEDAVRRAVEAAFAAGTNQVLIQAERLVRSRDVARLVRAATIPGVSVNLAVMEMD